MIVYKNTEHGCCNNCKKIQRENPELDFFSISLGDRDKGMSLQFGLCRDCVKELQKAIDSGFATVDCQPVPIESMTQDEEIQECLNERR